MTASVPAVLGIIGGSGVYQVAGVKVLRELDVQTPFGKPSDPVIEAELHGRTVYFLPRHGKGHRYLPTEVPYAANIFALKTLGVTHVMAVSAVGIMQEGIKPGNMVIPDQIYDRTKGLRRSTFFGEGVAGHVSFADPFCHAMRASLKTAAEAHTKHVHFGGAYICMEGPQFSTRAESNHYRNTIAPAIIGMTAIPEAKLAREAEMCYGLLALATDYDCWKENMDEQVSVEAVLAVLRENSELANRIIGETIKRLPATTACACLDSAQHAIMTNPQMIPPAAKERLKPLYGRYFNR